MEEAVILIGEDTSNDIMLEFLANEDGLSCLDCVHHNVLNIMEGIADTYMHIIFKQKIRKLFLILEYWM